MYKLLFPLLMLLFCDNRAYAQIKEYKLISKSDESDFAYTALYGIDTSNFPSGRRALFNPVRGKYTVYTFIATFTGRSYTNTEKEFHDILIVKTNKKNKIIDAFQYTLEWAEPPLSFDLYRAKVKGKKLVNNLPVDQLKFRKVNYYKSSERELNEQSVLAFDNEINR